MIRRAIALKLAVALGPLLVAGLLLTLLLTGISPPEEERTACGVPPAISVGTGAIAWPMAAGSYRLTSGYGMRWGTLHAGIDLAAPIGTPMYAAHDGVVAAAGPASGFGTWVIIDGALPDGSRFSTVYGHMRPASLLVKVGDVVTAGQPIAGVGAEGQSTGPHLHFEVWPGTRLDGGSSVDPIGWLAANVQPGDTAPQPEPAPEPAEEGGEIILIGQVGPQGPQSSMQITPEQQNNINAIVSVAKGLVPDDPATPLNETLRVATIAVATAMQESRLRVIDFGDLAGPDSRGLFQQRDPWGPYAERMDPVISTQLFLNGGRGGQRGLLSHDWRTQSLEAVVVQTQISVGGYAKWETQAMTLVAAAAGVTAADVGAPVVCAAL